MEEDPCCRVVAHFDLDAFYAGCEREANPSVIGVPLGVAQYNPLGDLSEVGPEEIDRRLIVRPGRRGDQNGSLIAVSYEARACDVTRNMRVAEAVECCPSLRVVQVPVRHGKACLNIYRNASARVLSKLTEGLMDCALSKEASKNMLVEKASIDEIYVDLTSIVDEYMEQQQLSSHLCRMSMEHEHNAHWDRILNEFGAAESTIGGMDDSSTFRSADGLSKDELRRGSSLQLQHGLGSGSQRWWNRRLAGGWTEDEIRLAVGAGIASRARASVAEAFLVETNDKGKQPTYTLSAGISHNKTLAKLASGMRKPNSQTICCADTASLRKLFHPLPIGRIRGLGGKLGQKVADALDVATVGELAEVPISRLEGVVDEGTARFLHDISRGVCRDPVQQRTTVKSIGCGKTFRGTLAFSPRDTLAVERWVKELSDELGERLTEDRDNNRRVPQNFGVTIKYGGKNISKSAPSLPRRERYREVAFRLVQEIVSQQDLSADMGGVGLIEGLTIFAGSFMDVASGKNSIAAAFGRVVRNSCNNSARSAAQSPLNASKVSPSRASVPLGISRKRTRLAKTNFSLEEAFAKAVPDRTGTNNKAPGVCASSPPPSSNGKSNPLHRSIDPEVFHQLPASIQQEIRAAGVGGGAAEGSALPREKKSMVSGGISSWLKGAGQTAAGSARQQNAATADQTIDEDVLAELPPEIQAEILASRQHRQHRPKKVRCIDAFFGPN
mmetsp:Transcript_22102/g.53543  ORF Transcript_22102/g.53543 Transcript_22102/m.53543 type:complete len:726 (-) Transcript_22102:502-2679(-)|eukprot:CAMPEP_0181087124 /NCGR_PEP_ID=MMETSP1071-20121207/6109_1 /TAXON_ID=35127 /ORGANISM="Thalassiosira sp., Strain NH16" /LENGTH=725 /DNA_ID=CAMNT_0023168999 /DNA_START=191 /DNA_END=2368 /DNA_ORIENTATION=-